MTHLFSTLCLCWAIMLTLPVQGQQTTPATSLAIAQYEHITLVATNGGNAILDYGQGREEEKLQAKKEPVTERQIDAAAVRKLQSAMLALDYLSSRGWECLGISSRQKSSGSTTSGSFDIYSSTEYLLRRRKQ